jgi:hypothetical protein
MFAAIIAFSLQSFSGYTQDDKSKRPSPPANVTEKIGNTTVTIDYSQPAVKGRTIWGDLVPYDKVWRTGANEATTFEVSNDVKVEGKTLPAGKYGLFTIPGKDEWTIIFNSVPDQWGAFEYDPTKDVLKVNVKPKKSPEAMEKMTFKINKNGTVSLLWEKLEVDFNVSAK